jgi:hypothetical protein
MPAKPFPVFLLSAAAVMACTALVSFFPFLRSIRQPWIVYFALIATGACCWSYWKASASSRLGANVLARIVGVAAWKASASSRLGANVLARIVGVAALGAASFGAFFLAASWTWVLLGNQM